MRFFTTAGPVKPERHYFIPPLERLNLAELLALIRDEKYFVLHAPRQTGKTSSLLALRDLLNGEGTYRCVYVNVEAGQAGREDVEQVIRTVLGALASRASLTLDDEFLLAVWSGILAEFGPHSALQVALTRWAQASSKPLVLLIDEIDALIGDSLLSVLRQLRAGYDMRPEGFPQSVVLCGVRDYRIQSTQENAIITGGSAFNIKAESLRLGDFSRQEVWALLGQHTLQRIVNGGGRIEREYGLGRMRVDLLIVWPQREQTQRFVIECKVLHKSLEQTIAEGLVQTAAYMDGCAAEAGHLVIFDRREGRRWSEKVFHQRRKAESGVAIDVWGM